MSVVRDEPDATIGPHATFILPSLGRVTAPYSCLRLISHHKRILAIDGATGAVLNVDRVGGNLHPLILMSASSNSQRCFLIADLSVSAVVTDPNAMIIACERERIEETTLALRYSGTTAYLSARGEDQEWCVFAVPERKRFEVFTAIPEESTQLGAVTREVMEILSKVLGDVSTDLNNVLSELAGSANGLADAIVTKGLICLLRECDGELLLSEFCRNPNLANMLQKVFANDFYAVDAIPRLLAWCSMRDRGIGLPSTDRYTPMDHTIGSGIQRIGSERDHLASDFRAPSPMLELNALLRSSVKPRGGTAVLTTARNEGLYLLEWIAYYRVLGMEKIFIVSNQNDDGSEDLLQLLAEHGVIHLTFSDVGAGVSAQDKGYGHHLRGVPDVLEYRWLLICDMDEFLVIDPGRFADLQSFADFHSASGGDSIAINWVVYCSDKKYLWHDEPMFARFQTPEAVANRHLKTMSKPRNLIHSLPHQPVYRAGYTPRRVTAQGQPHIPDVKMGFSGTAEPEAGGAVINHYFYRSAAEFFTKFARNRGDHPVHLGRSAQALPQSMLAAFINQFSRSRAAIHPGMSRILPSVMAEKQRLRSLAGIRAAEEKVHRAFIANLPDVLRLFEESAVVAAAGDPASLLLQETRLASKSYSV